MSDLIAATHAEALRVPGDLTARRVCTDSRAVQSGDLFWAISGQRHDGHDFVAEAHRKGAAASVVARDRAAALEGPLLAVEGTQQALADFAAWYRQQREALVVGVTGSVGKTTTREMIHAVLSARHTGIRTKNNENNEIGLPLSLLELAAAHEFGVFELGARHIGDIRRLCEIAKPEVGVVTRIGASHLASFGSLENIYLAKGELLESLPAHGFAVVCGDDDAMRRMARRSACSVILVGETLGNKLRATNVDFQPGRLRFIVDRRAYELAVPARHYLSAALCALAVAREIGMNAAAIAEGFGNFRGAPGRCQVEKTGQWTLIDDTYNASPLSMQAACLCLKDWPASGQRMLIAGDMLELGDAAAQSHAELGECAAATRIDRLLAVGEQAEHVAEGALRAGMSPHQIAECRDFDALLAVLDCWLGAGDVVLVKGSRGMRMERIVQWIRERGSTTSQQTMQFVARAVA